MLCITSPAKTFLEEKIHTECTGTMPQFLDKTVVLHEYLKKLSYSKIAKIFKVSEQIAELNFARFQNWNHVHTSKNSRPAISYFYGDVFKGLDTKTLTTADIDFSQHSLRILSGFYGCLCPLDLIQQYRLEMGTSLHMTGYASLVEFWKETVTHSLRLELQTHTVPILINAASVEYSHVIDPVQLGFPILNIRFLQQVKRKQSTIAIYTKKARGQFLRHIIDTRANDLDDVRSFQTDGYRLVDETAGEMVFLKKI